MKLSQTITYITDQLYPAYGNKQTATAVAWWLLQKATSKSRVELIYQQEVDDKTLGVVQVWINSILHDHMPVQYIIGSVPFLDLDILVKQPILIPRPETEQWCKQLIDAIKSTNKQEFTILDLCSGTGCIALSLAHAFPYSHVIAGDINPAACKLIEHNKKHNTIKNCMVIESDLFENMPINQKYSVITSNPPYVTLQEWQQLEPRVKLWESPQALVAQNNGLQLIEKIIEQAPDYLENPLPGVAQVWIEIGETQAEKVVELFRKNGYKKTAVIKDIYDKNRVVTGSLYE